MSKTSKCHSPEVSKPQTINPSLWNHTGHQIRGRECGSSIWWMTCRRPRGKGAMWGHVSPGFNTFWTLTCSFSVTHDTHAMGPHNHRWPQHAMSSPGVWPFEVFNVSTSESVKEWSRKFKNTVNLRSLRDLSQPLDPTIERCHKYLGEYHYEGVEQLGSCNVLKSRSIEVPKWIRIVHPNAWFKSWPLDQQWKARVSTSTSITQGELSDLRVVMFRSLRVLKSRID